MLIREVKCGSDAREVREVWCWGCLRHVVTDGLIRKIYVLGLRVSLSCDGAGHIVHVEASIAFGMS